MTPTRWKIAIGFFVLAVVAAVSAGGMSHPAPATGKPSAKDRQAFADARCKAARKAYDQVFEAYHLGVGAMPHQETVYLWSRRWLEADLDASSKRADQVAAYQRH